MFSIEYKPPISFPLVLNAETGYGISPLKSTDPLNMNVYTIGLGAGLQYPFLTRLSLGASVRGGYFFGTVKDELGNPIKGGNPYVAGGSELSFFITPSFAIGIGADIRSLTGPKTALLDTVSARLGTLYRFPISGSIGFGPEPKRITPFQLVEIKADTILPVFYQWYDENPIGTVVVKNTGKTTLRDLKMTLLIRRYMDSPKEFEVPGEIAPGANKEIDLYALFTEKVLEITEGTKVAAEIGYSFTTGRQRWTDSSVETLKLENRNASVWDDDRRIATFVTARDPAVLAYAKTVANMVRSGTNQSLDYSLRTAIAIHGALGLSGIGYVPDPKTPYVEFIKNAQAIDFLQFPRQTLTYKAGDCDDLSILYTALLSAASVETAFLTVPGHIFIAFTLESAPDAATKTFGSTEGLIIRDGKVWIPLEVTLVRENFLKAWQEGAREWKEYIGSTDSGFYPLADAWKVFAPVGLPGETDVTLPPETRISAAYNEGIALLADWMIGPRVKELETRIAQAKDTQRLYNQLGLLYARFGLLDKAEPQFAKSTAIRSYAPALYNLGNVYALRKDSRKALRYYLDAFKQDPGNPKTVGALAQTYRILGMSAEFERTITQLAAISPDAAKQVAEAVPESSDSSRAANASGKEIITWEE